MEIPDPKFSVESPVFFKGKNDEALKGIIWRVEYVFFEKTMNDPPHRAYYVSFPERSMWVDERFLYQQ